MRKKFLWVLLACVLAFSLAAFTACEADMTDEDTVRATGVTLNETSISLAVGEQFQLTATPTPENATDTITWHTSDKSIAEVTQDGLVTAVSLGTVEGATTATVTITVQIYTAKATCTVTVTPAEDLPAESVDLPDTASVETGSTTTLSATVLPQGTTDEVVWTIVSGDEYVEIAPSSDGLTCTVEGVAAGSAVIRATAGDFSDTCTVTVTDNGGGTEPEPPVEVESVTVTPETAQVDIAGTVSLTAELAPAGATGTVVWSTSDDAVATVSQQGVVTGVSEGKTTITATVNSSISDTCIVSVTPNTVTISGTTYTLSLGTASSVTNIDTNLTDWWNTATAGQSATGDFAVVYTWEKTDTESTYNTDIGIDVISGAVFDENNYVTSATQFYTLQIGMGGNTGWGDPAITGSAYSSAVRVNGDAWTEENFPGTNTNSTSMNGNNSFSFLGNYETVIARVGSQVVLQVTFVQAGTGDVYVYTYTALYSTSADLAMRVSGNPYYVDNITVATGTLTEVTA